MGLFNTKEKRITREDRQVALSEIYETVFDLIALADQAENKHTITYDIYFDDNENRFYTLALRDGIIYKVETFADESGVSIGEFIEVQPNNATERTIESKITVYETKRAIHPDDDEDDENSTEMKWLSIASVAVLNRSGEIDSRELFDSFISFAQRTGQYPILNVYHLGDDSKVGQAHWLGRKEYVYMAMGTFDNNEVGRRFFQALKKRNDWGNSIEFYSPRSHIEKFELDTGVIEIPVYKTGINTGITLLKEEHAASVFTSHTQRG